MYDRKYDVGDVVVGVGVRVMVCISICKFMKYQIETNLKVLFFASFFFGSRGTKERGGRQPSIYQKF